jgi:hypothetical protein
VVGRQARMIASQPGSFPRRSAPRTARASRLNPPNAAGAVGAQVAVDPERKLRPPADAGREPGAESLEQALRAGVPDRIADGGELKAEVESGRGRDRGKRRQVDRRAARRLEAVDRGLRYPRRAFDGTEAEAGGSTGACHLVDCAAQIALDSADCPVDRLGSPRHAGDRALPVCTADHRRVGGSLSRGVGIPAAGVRAIALRPRVSGRSPAAWPAGRDVRPLGPAPTVRVPARRDTSAWR